MYSCKGRYLIELGWDLNPQPLDLESGQVNELLNHNKTMLIKQDNSTTGCAIHALGTISLKFIYDINQIPNCSP